MDELSANNLFASMNTKAINSVSANAMYVVNDEKQKRKMAAEFYIDIGKQIEEYQERIEYLIKSGSESTAILNRWLLKIEGLEQMKVLARENIKREIAKRPGRIKKATIAVGIMLFIIYLYPIFLDLKNGLGIFN